MRNTVRTPRWNAAALVHASRRAFPAIVLTVAGLLGSSANAQLVHRYDFETVNDVVGTAHGTLVGTATLSGGALVTDGQNGKVSGTWTGTGPRMTLPPAAVAGLTNKFSIETWFTCTTDWPKNDSLYAFSDGNTANYLVAAPVKGYSPWPSGVDFAGGGGSNTAGVFGIYLDTPGTHQTVLTYDGTNFSWYVDGVLANFGGLASTAADPGFNLSTLTAIGINGGSPWNDPSLTGSTYDFRIYGQALTPAQVASIFALGENATTSSITNALAPPTAFTWDGGGADNNWATAQNWNGDVAPGASGTSLTFSGSTRTSPNMEANYSVTGLTFGNLAGAFTLGSDNGSTLTLGGSLLNSSTNAQILNMALNMDISSTFTCSTGTVTLNGVVSGGGSILKQGSGVLELNAANSVSGATVITEGAVKLGDANALQSSGVTLNAANGLTFKNGVGTFNIGNLTGTNGTALTDASAGAVTLVVGANNGGSGYSGVLSGNGSLTKVGTGTLDLNGESTYAGGTVVSGGILAARNARAPGLTTPFGSGSITVEGGATLEVGYAPNDAFGSYRMPNSVTLNNGNLYAGDGSHRILGNLTIGTGGGAIGSTYDAPWEVLVETNFPKSLFIDGLVTGTGNLAVQHTGWNLGNAWDTSCAVFTSQGTAAQNTYSGTISVNPMSAGNGGSYLYIVGSNALANATISLNGDNDSASGRMGVGTLLFGNGSLPGPGNVTIGGLAGGGSLVLQDTVLFQGGKGYSNGAPVALSVGRNNSSSSFNGVVSGSGSLIKIGSGTLTLSTASTYTGDTKVESGNLTLTGGWLNSTNITVSAGATLDATGISPVTMAGGQALLNAGTVAGGVNMTAGSRIYAGTASGYGTNIITGDLNMSAGAVAYLELGTSATAVNDRIVVGGTISANGNVIHLKAPSTVANLDTAADYVLFSSANDIVGTFSPAPVWDIAPANAGHYALITASNVVLLHYYPDYNGPTGFGTVTPAPVVRNQTLLVTVWTTNGNPGTVSGVVVDATQIGVTSPVTLLPAGGNAWTNSTEVSADTLAGSKTLMATISDSASFAASIPIPVNVVVGNNVWNGGGSDNNLTSNLNWTDKSAPGYVGDSLEFAGAARLTPNVNNNYSLTGITFAAGAESFTLASDNNSTLTLTGSGIVNQSLKPQTLNIPVTMTAAQTFDASAGNLVLSQSLAKGNNLLTVTGAATTVLSGPISDGGSLFKRDSGSLIISSGSTWDQGQASSGGLSGPFIAQAGTVAFNSGSTHTVTGELVVGGVITNGAVGNNARVVVDNATLTVSSWFSLGRGNGTGTVSSDLVLTNNGSVTAANLSAGYNANNAANKPKGSITLSDTSTLTVTGGSLYVGESDGADMMMNVNGTASVVATSATMDVGANSGKGVLNVNGGSVAVNVLRVGRGANLNSTAQGTVTLNSGSLRTEGDIVLGFAGSGANGNLGQLVINGGTMNFATTTTRWMIFNQWDTSRGQLDVNGGQLNINGNSSIRFSTGNSGSQGTSVINLNGGAITFYSDNATTVGGTGQLDLQRSGGAGSSGTFNLNGGTLTVPQVMAGASSGSRVFNFNGGTLKATTNSTEFVRNLSAAYVKPGGAIIDDGGYAITIAQRLLDAGGGLTKKGAGTLSLTGTNTYTGNTTVTAGTLSIAQPTLAGTSTVTVNSGAILQLGFTGTNRVSSLVLGGVTMAPGIYDSTSGAPYLTGGGKLLVQPIAANPTNITFAVSGGTMMISWPEDHLGWILQQQTNSLSTGLSTNWVDIAGTAAITSTNLPINPANPTVFYRLRKP